MKAKELAEQLLKYPDFEVKFDIDTETTIFSRAYPYLVEFNVNGVDEIVSRDKIIFLDVEEVGEA